MAGPTRLELATSGVTGRRSNQLNYDPAVVVFEKTILPQASGRARPGANSLSCHRGDKCQPRFENFLRRFSADTSSNCNFFFYSKSPFDKLRVTLRRNPLNPFYKGGPGNARSKFLFLQLCPTIAIRR